MKTILKIYFLPLLLIACAWGCNKDENKIIYQGGTAPVLTVQTGAEVSYADTGKIALSLMWTNPNYTFNTGASSLDVTYNIEIDTMADFSNPLKKVITVSKELSYDFLVEDLNEIMLNQLLLQPGPHTLQIRVVSGLTNSSAQIVSNAVQVDANAYAIPPKVTPPSSGHLYLVGSATKGGWNNPVPVPTQEFTQISPTKYEITVDLIGGQEYLLIPVNNGDWSHKYAVKDKTVSGLSSGGDFGYDLSDNFPGPANSGTYKITVDFQTGKFSVVAQ